MPKITPPITDKQIGLLSSFDNTVFSNKFVKRYGQKAIIDKVWNKAGLKITLRKVVSQHESEPDYFVAEVVGRKRKYVSHKSL